jgi:hypothetical protein
MKLDIVKQLQTIRDEKSREVSQLQQAIDALRPNGKSPQQGPQGRRTLSLAARKKIAAAQRERWAAWHKRSKRAA